MPKLDILDSEGQKREIPLGERDLRIGRGEQNDIVLPDATKAVSRSHAELRYENGQYVLVDVNSQNGLWVGGERVPSVVLTPGVPVVLGTYTLVFEGPLPAMVETMIAGAAPTIIRPVSPPAAAASAPARRLEQPTPDATVPKPAPASSLRKTGSVVTSKAALLLTGVALVLIVAVIVIVATRRHQPAQEAASQIAPPQEVVPPPSPGPTIDEQVRDHVALARNHLAAQELDDAIAELDRALDLDPSNSDALELKKNADEEKQRLAAAQNAQSQAKTTNASPKGPGAKSGQPPAALPPIPQRAGETVESWNARWKAVQDRYEQARVAVAGNSFQTAIAILMPIQRDEPSYRDAAILLGQARNGLRDQQALVDAAAKLETAGDLRGALAQYKQALQMGASVSAAVDRLQERMKSEGTRWFKEADPYFTLNRTKEAIERYERAYELLPDDDPNRAIAKERLDKLRGR